MAEQLQIKNWLGSQLKNLVVASALKENNDVLEYFEIYIDLKILLLIIFFS